MKALVIISTIRKNRQANYDSGLISEHSRFSADNPAAVIAGLAIALDDLQHVNPDEIQVRIFRPDYDA